ncbi:high-temperature-induced dauer-formation protein-domain-containing protein [Aspergillus terricola var. indicus]
MVQLPGIEPSIQIGPFHAGMLAISVHTLITTRKGNLTTVYTALLAIINDNAAYAGHLTTGACSKGLRLFTSMSEPSFLLANGLTHALLASVLKSVNAVLEHKFTIESTTSIFS